MKNEPVRAVLAIAVALLIVAMLAFARGERHGLAQGSLRRHRDAGLIRPRP